MGINYKYKWEIVDGDIKTVSGKVGNFLLAWTFGQLTNVGWDSEKAPNLQAISEDLTVQLKRNANRLTFAIPMWAKEFTFKPNKMVDKFNVYFLKDLSSNPIIGLTFRNLTISSVTPRPIPQAAFGYNNSNYSYQEVLGVIEGGGERFL